MMISRSTMLCGFLLPILLSACTAPQDRASAQPVALAAESIDVEESSALATASADEPVQAAPTATVEDTEGDESLVGLLGEWRIFDSLLAHISAMSLADARALHGKDIEIAPDSINTPWHKCESVSWTHRALSREAWLESWNAPVLTPTQEKVLETNGTNVTLWETSRCNGTPVQVFQLTGDAIAILHDGAVFVAKIQPRR